MSKRSKSVKRGNNEYSIKKSVLSPIINSLNQSKTNPEIIVPIDQNYQLNIESLLGRANIFQGCSHLGKKSCARYLADMHQLQIVMIDCQIYQTQKQFLDHLTKGVGKLIDVSKVSLNSTNVLGQSVCLENLNQIIIKANARILFVITHSQKLVSAKKQLILYNLLEWMKSPINKYVGILLLTTLLNITDQFEKRVKSRYNGTAYWFMYPTQSDVIKVLLKRLQSCSSKNNQVVQSFYGAIKDNKKLQNILRQEYSKIPKNYTYYLNVFKIVFASFSNCKVNELDHKTLIDQISKRYLKYSQYMQPNLKINQNLLQNLDQPEYLIMSICRNMIINKRLPITLNTIFEVYQQFLKRCSVNYPKRVFQRSIKKLYELKILNVQKVHQNIQNKDITIRMYIDEIQNAIKSIPNPHTLIKSIINS